MIFEKNKVLLHSVSVANSSTVCLLPLPLVPLSQIPLSSLSWYASVLFSEHAETSWPSADDGPSPSRSCHALSWSPPSSVDRLGHASLLQSSSSLPSPTFGPWAFESLRNLYFARCSRLFFRLGILHMFLLVQLESNS